MPEVENKPKNLVKNRSPQGHFEGQDSFSLNELFLGNSFDIYQWRPHLALNQRTSSFAC